MKDNAKDLRAVQDRMVKVKSQVQEMAAQDEKHLRWALGIKIVLLVFVAIYMGWAYVNFRTVDAELLVISGQQKFYEALPDLKSQMINRLNALAPSLINQTSDALIKGVPKFERQLETTAKRTLLKYSDVLQKDFAAWLSTYIHESKSVVDEMFPDTDISSFEKLTRFRKYIIDDFRDGVEVVSYQIGDSLREQTLVPQMKKLLEGKGLTEKEKLQRDILAISYLLIERSVSDLDLKKFVGQLEPNK